MMLYTIMRGLSGEQQPEIPSPIRGVYKFINNGNNHTTPGWYTLSGTSGANYVEIDGCTYLEKDGTTQVFHRTKNPFILGYTPFSIMFNVRIDEANYSLIDAISLIGIGHSMDWNWPFENIAIYLGGESRISPPGRVQAVAIGDSSAYVTGTTDITDGVIHNICLTCSGGEVTTFKIYVDGILEDVSTEMDGVNIKDGDVGISLFSLWPEDNLFYDSNPSWKGLINNLYLFDIELKDYEIQGIIEQDCVEIPVIPSEPEIPDSQKFILEIDTTKTSGTATASDQFKFSPLAVVVSYTIDWGDGNTEVVTTPGDKTHTYDSPGVYIVKVWGWCSAVQFINKDAVKIIEVQNLGHLGWTSFSQAFASCTNMTSFTVGDTNTTANTSLQLCWYLCTSLVHIDLTGMDTQNVTGWNSAFQQSTNLEGVNMSTASGKSAINANQMFYGCTKLKSSGIDLSYFISTQENKVSTDNMFSGCNHADFKNIDISGMKMNGSCESMFYGCTNIETITCVGVDTSSVTSLSGFCAACTKLQAFDISDFDLSSCISIANFFQQCFELTTESITGLDVIDTSNVQNFDGLFWQCTIESIDLSNLDATSANTMSYMFLDCTSLTSVDVSGFISSMTSAVIASRMFENTRCTTIDISGMKIYNMSRMFHNNINLTSVTLAGVDTSACVSMSGTFRQCNILTAPDFSSFDTSNVLTFAYMFEGGNTVITTLDLSTFNTSNSIDFSGMLMSLVNMTTLVTHATNFKIEKATSTYNMFYNDYSLTDVGSIDFSGTSDLTQISGMFGSCTALSIISNLHQMDVSAVTSASFQNPFMSGNALTSPTLKDIYDNWGAQTVNSGVEINFGTNTYDSGNTGRASLISQGWTLNDGGPI